MSFEEARTSLVDIPRAKKASRRWIVDMLMLVVGSLIGVYAGSAPARAYAATLISGKHPAAVVQPQAQAEATASAQPEALVVSVQRPRAPELNHAVVETQAQPTVATPAPEAKPVPVSSKPARGGSSRRSGTRSK